MLFGNGYSGPIGDLNEGGTVCFEGPPYSVDQGNRLAHHFRLDGLEHAALVTRADRVLGKLGFRLTGVTDDEGFSEFHFGPWPYFMPPV